MSIRLVNGVYLADTARVMGCVELGPDVNVWYGVTIRGDVAKVTIGQGTNIQDNAVIHCDYDQDMTIGQYVTIGHGAVVHGQSVGDYTLIGMNATVTGRVRIGSECIIAAGAVLAPGTEVAAGSVVMGVPGKVVREATKQERAFLHSAGPQYVQTAKLHCGQPDDARVRVWGQGNDQWQTGSGSAEGNGLTDVPSAGN